MSMMLMHKAKSIVNSVLIRKILSSNNDMEIQKQIDNDFGLTATVAPLMGSLLWTCPGTYLNCGLEVT